MFQPPFKWSSFMMCPPPPVMFTTAEDNDVFIKNTTINPAGSVGPPGPPGPQGPQGPQGSPGLTPTVKPATENTLGAIRVGKCLSITDDGILSVKCCECKKKTILIKQDYTIESDDWYIGVNCKSPVTISLIDTVEDGFELIVKLEVGAPIGNRKVTIKPTSNQKIDGNSSKILQEPYESMTLVFRSNNWYII
jgi:hypothetical protein